MILVVAWVVRDEAFFDSFLANFLSTSAGFVLGVPVAIWLALRQTKEQREAEEKAEKTVSQRHRDDVLTAIRRELHENRTTLLEDRYDKDGGRNFAVPFLMDEVWSAMSDGGQLQWITDLEVLRRLARAYVFVRSVIYLEKQAFEVTHYPGTRAVLEDTWTKGQRKADLPRDRIVGYLVHQDRVCVDAINEALQLLDPVLGLAADTAALP